MSSGRLINGVKYMYIHQNYDCNKMFIYDKVYYILRGIFANSDSIYIIMKASDFNHSLTGGISFENSPNRLGYSTVLHNKYFVDSLLKWLNDIDENNFKFLEPKDEEINMDRYMKWDEWWDQFIELRNLIREQYDKICMWEEEDLGRDMDRLCELMDDNFDY